jgi:hypothetical protein
MLIGDLTQWSYNVILKGDQGNHTVDVLTYVHDILNGNCTGYSIM